MSEIVEVRLFETPSLSNMEKTVNHLVKQGYQPLSSVTTQGNMYLITLVKYKPEVKPKEPIIPIPPSNLSYIKE